MDNFEKFNSEKLSASKMKEVQGGGLIDSVLGIVKGLEPLILPLITA